MFVKDEKTCHSIFKKYREIENLQISTGARRRRRALSRVSLQKRRSKVKGSNGRPHGEFDKPIFGSYNTISSAVHVGKRGEEVMETKPDLKKMGYELMDSGLN